MSDGIAMLLSVGILSLSVGLFAIFVMILLLSGWVIRLTECLD